jgi:hypothetical protein
MTSVQRRRRKFVGKINGHLNDALRSSKTRIAMWVYGLCLFDSSNIHNVDLSMLCYMQCTCLSFGSLLLCVNYIHWTALYSFMNLSAVWNVSNSSCLFIMFDGQMRWYGMVYEGYLIPIYIISQQGVFYHC